MKGKNALLAVIKTPFVKSSVGAVQAELAKAREQLQEQRRVRYARAANPHNTDAIFIWVPKTAGTSLWARLASLGGQLLLTTEAITAENPRGGICSFGHIPLEDLLEAGLLDRDYYQRAWKFALVRNPFDRTVSLFEYLKGRGDLPPTTTFSIFCQYLAEGAYVPLGLYNHWNLNQLNPQVAWLKDRHGRILADFVGHYENLVADAETIFNQLGCPARSLERLNPSRRQPLAAYYSEREIEIVRECYREDFQAFGYDTHPELDCTR